MQRDRSVFPQSFDNFSDGQERPYSYILLHVARDIFWRFASTFITMPIRAKAFNIIYRDRIIDVGRYAGTLIKYRVLTTEPSSLADSKRTLSRSSVYRARVAR